MSDPDRYIDGEPLRALRTELLSTIERADRSPIYRRIELKMLQELPIIPLGWGSPRATQDLFIIGTSVRGFHDPVTGYGRLENLDRTWTQR